MTGDWGGYPQLTALAKVNVVRRACRLCEVFDVLTGGRVMPADRSAVEGGDEKTAPGAERESVGLTRRLCGAVGVEGVNRGTCAGVVPRDVVGAAYLQISIWVKEYAQSCGARDKLTEVRTRRAIELPYARRIVRNVEVARWPPLHGQGMGQGATDKHVYGDSRLGKPKDATSIEVQHVDICRLDRWTRLWLG